MADIDANEVENIENQPQDGDVVKATDKSEVETTENNDADKDAETADDHVNEAGDAAEDDTHDNESGRKRKSITAVDDEGDSKKAKTDDDDAEVPASNGVDVTTKTADDVVQRLENEEEVAA